MPPAMPLWRNGSLLRRSGPAEAAHTRPVTGGDAGVPNGRNWVGSRPAAFAGTPSNSGQAVFHQNADVPRSEERQVVAPCPFRQVLADRHDLDLDRIRDLLPILVTGPSRQPVPSG